MKLKIGNEFMHNIKHHAGNCVDFNTVKKSIFF